MSSASRKAYARHVAFGALAFAAGLVWLLPATLLDRRISNVTSGAIRVAAAEGTVWSGQGYIDLRRDGKPTGYSRYVSWRFIPRSVFQGQLEFAFRLNHSGKDIPVVFGLSGIELRDVSIDLPAISLEMAMPEILPLGLGGDLSLNLAEVVLNGNQSTGRGRIEWRNVASAMTAVAPLGHYQIDIVGELMTRKVAVRTLEGPLQINGEGEWPAGTPPVFRGNARVPPELQQQLAPMLRLIAAEKGPGDFELRIPQSGNPVTGKPAIPKLRD